MPRSTSPSPIDDDQYASETRARASEEDMKYEYPTPTKAGDRIGTLLARKKTLERTLNLDSEVTVGSIDILASSILTTFLVAKGRAKPQDHTRAAQGTARQRQSVSPVYTSVSQWLAISWLFSSPLALPCTILTKRVAGTVISVHHDTDLKSTLPIMDRIHQAGSGLRASPDASLLVQSLLDLGTPMYRLILEKTNEGLHQWLIKHSTWCKSTRAEF